LYVPCGLTTCNIHFSSAHTLPIYAEIGVIVAGFGRLPEQLLLHKCILKVL
jgi:hypothetical protein